MNIGMSLIYRVFSGEHLKSRGLSGAVDAQKPKAVSIRDVKTYSFHGLEVVVPRFIEVGANFRCYFGVYFKVLFYVWLLLI